MAAIGTQLTESVVGSVIWTVVIEYVSILKAIMTYLLDRAIHKSKY